MMREVASYKDSTSLKLVHKIQHGIEMVGGLKKFCKS